MPGFSFISLFIGRVNRPDSIGIVTTTISFVSRFIFPRLFIYIIVHWGVVVPIQSGSSRLQYPGSYFQVFHLYHCSLGRGRPDSIGIVPTTEAWYILPGFSFISLFIGACGRPDSIGIVTTTIPSSYFQGFFHLYHCSMGVVVPIQSGSSRPETWYIFARLSFYIIHLGRVSSRFNRDRHDYYPWFIFPRLFIYIIVHWGVVVPIQSGSSTTIP